MLAIWPVSPTKQVITFKAYIYAFPNPYLQAEIRGRARMANPRDQLREAAIKLVRWNVGDSSIHLTIQRVDSVAELLEFRIIFVDCSFGRFGSWRSKPFSSKEQLKQ